MTQRKRSKRGTDSRWRSREPEVSKGEVDSYLPLTPLAFEVLLSLAGGSRHGYAILQDIEERSDGALVPHAGTLYRVIFRLLDQGLVEESEDRPAPARDDSRRRYYNMTSLGHAVAVGEATRLANGVATARARRLLDRPSTA